MSTKDFLYYWISIKEGLNIETERSHLEIFIDKKCTECCELFLIAKSFKTDEGVCDICFKTVNDIDKFAKIHIIWVNNSKYRACTHLWRRFAGEIMRKEGSLDKYGYIDVNKYNNKTTSLWEVSWNQREPLSCIALA